MSMRLTGGCQCGAIRYEIDMQPENAHVCHCRMCQKAVGGPFAVICPVLVEHFRLTRGTMSYLNSSTPTQRGFCSNCGTPMTFEYHNWPDLGLLVGTFDNPSLVPPVVQYGNESRVAWFRDLASLPGDRATYDGKGEMLGRIASSNRQHPDHDTDRWTPEPRR